MVRIILNEANTRKSKPNIDGHILDGSIIPQVLSTGMYSWSLG